MRVMITKLAKGYLLTPDSPFGGTDVERGAAVSTWDEAIAELVLFFNSNVAGEPGDAKA